MAAFSEESISAAITDSMSLVGVEEPKKEQSQAIRSFVSGRDVFVALPTGYGKSFCYALLPLVFDRLRAATHKSIVICVSPLTALMADQREKFTTKGIAAEFVGELQQDINAMDNVRTGQCQLVYISPESILRNPQWREMLLTSAYKENLVGLVIDEAHCITKW